MGVDLWVDRGNMFPYFLKWRGRPVFCLPTFLGVAIFVLMHTVFIYWMIGASFVKFQLILMKIIKIVATISDFKAKTHQI